MKALIAFKEGEMPPFYILVCSISSMSAELLYCERQEGLIVPSDRIKIRKRVD